MVAQQAEHSRPLKAFFKQVGGSNPCEACGSKEWFTYPWNPMYTLNAKESDQFPSPDFLVISCNNCGNSRFFNWGRIKYFIEHEYKEGDDA